MSLELGTYVTSPYDIREHPHDKNTGNYQMVCILDDPSKYHTVLYTVKKVKMSTIYADLSQWLLASITDIILNLHHFN